MSHVEHLLGELRSGEEPTRASNRVRQFTVEVNGGTGNPQFTLQSLNQADQVGHLPFGELASLAIAHKADPDGMLIVMGSGFTDDVGPGQLVIPAIPGVDFAIGQAIAIAEDEVVSQPLVPEAQMLSMNGLRRPEWFAEMMDHDAGPPIPIEVDGQIEDGIAAIGDRIEIRQIGQGEPAGGQGAAIEAEQSDSQCHCRGKTGPDDLGPASDRRFLSRCRVNGCHGRLVVQRKAALLQTLSIERMPART